MTRRFPAAGLVLGLLLPMTALGEDSTPDKVVTWGDWGPYVNKDHPGKGIASVIVKEAFKALGKDISIEFHPWTRAYKEAREGVFLGAYPYARNESRLKDFYFTEPLFTTRIRLFTSLKHPTPTGAPDEIKNPTVCLPQGYNKAVAEAWFDGQSLTLERPQRMENCLLMLDAGRINFVLVSEDVGWFIINAQPSLNVWEFSMKDKKQEHSVHIMVSRRLEGAASMAENLSQRIREMKANGEIEAIFDQYHAYPGR